MNDKKLLLAVFALLERENTVSIPQLAKLLGTSEETVWNALDTLVYCYDSVSIRLDLNESYASLVKDGTSRLLRLTKNETALLLDALASQGIAADSELARKLTQSKGFLSNSAEEALPHLRTVNHGENGAIMVQLASACESEEHHLVRIEYQRDGAVKAQPRVIEPYTISSDDDHRYLHAYSLEARGWRTFRADRIKSVEILDETFEPREDMPEGAELLLRDASRAHVHFVAGTQLPPWPEIKVVKRYDDGSYDASVPWLSGMWLPKHIVGLFGKALPLDPPELVSETREYAGELWGES